MKPWWKRKTEINKIITKEYKIYKMKTQFYKNYQSWNKDKTRSKWK
jgi:hypothetical protein